MSNATTPPPDQSAELALKQRVIDHIISQRDQVSQLLQNTQVELGLLKQDLEAARVELEKLKSKVADDKKASEAKP